MVGKPTKFEKTLGYTFQNAALRRAICRHRSVMSDEVAVQKYRYCQAKLAFLGDKSTTELIESSLGRIRPEHTKQRSTLVYLTQNRTMRLWIQEHNLGDFLIHNGFYVEESLDHIYGTFFEAIVQGLLIEKAVDFGQEWIDYYVRTSLARPEFVAPITRDNKSATVKSFASFGVYREEHAVYSELAEIQGFLESRCGGKLRASTYYSARKKAHIVTIDCRLRDIRGHKKRIELNAEAKSVEKCFLKATPLLKRRLMRIDSPAKDFILKKTTAEIASS